VETEYLYKYTANVTTFFYGTNKNASTLWIESEISMRFITPCEGYMEVHTHKISHQSKTIMTIAFQLQKTSLTESTMVEGAQYKGSTATASSATFAEALQENAIRFEYKDVDWNQRCICNVFMRRFSFRDGEIDELCPQSGELSWVLNFKRGILSSLQNTMERFDVDHVTTEVRHVILFIEFLK
jgi:Lipoprotein amino terminal region